MALSTMENKHITMPCIQNSVDIYDPILKCAQYCSNNVKEFEKGWCIGCLNNVSRDLVEVKFGALVCKCGSQYIVDEKYVEAKLKEIKNVLFDGKNIDTVEYLLKIWHARGFGTVYDYKGQGVFEKIIVDNGGDSGGYHD